MGIYKYTDSQTGKTYSFEHGGDAPTNEDWGAMAQIINADRERINQLSLDITGSPLLPEDDGTALGRGLDIGATSAYGALGTAARSAGEGIGIDFLRRLGAGMEQSAREEQLREATQLPAPTRFADVENFGDFLTFIGEGAGQTTPEMLATIGGGLLGGLAGTAQGGPVGGAAGFIAGSTAVGTPLFFGRNIQRQEQQVEAGALPEVDRMNAFLTAGGQAILNSVGDKILATGRLLGISIPPSQNLFVRVGQYGAAGAVVEVPTEITQQIMERAQAGLPLDSEDAIAEYIEAGILGGVIGAGVGGGLGAFRGPEAPPAPPGATPPAAGPTPAPAIPPAPPAVPPVPPVTPPAPATVVNARTATVAGGPMLIVSLSDGQRLTLPANATQADIDAAVAQYNSAQKQIISPAGPSVPPVQVAPTVPPVATPPAPGLSAEESAAIEEEAQQGTPVEQTRTLLRSLLGPRLRPNMYQKLEALGVGPDDPTVLSELEQYIPVYQRNQKLMDFDPGLPARLRRHIDETRARQAAEAARVETQPTAPTSRVAPTAAPSPEFALEPAEPVGGGASVPRYTPLTEAEAFEAAAELAAQTRAAQPRPVGGTVAPTPTTPSGASTQPGALEEPLPGRMSEADIDRMVETEQPTTPDAAAPEPASGIELSGIDTAEVFGINTISVIEDGKPVPFTNFALSVDADAGRAEVGMVEKGVGVRRGIGRDVYVALGEDLAARGITLQSSDPASLQAPGKKLWERLVSEGKARRNPQTKRFEFVATAAQPTTFDAAAIEQNVPPASSVPLDPAYSEEAAKQATQEAASFVPTEPGQEADAETTLVGKGGDPLGAVETAMSPETALRIRRQLRDAQIYPIDFVPLESQARLEQAYDQERVRFEQQYAIRPDQRGMPYLRTPVDQWTGYDWYQAKQDMPEQIAPLEAAFIARERGRAPMLDRVNNLAYELRQVAPELEEQIARDPVAIMDAALADTGIPEIEPTFRPQQGKDPFGAVEDATSMATEARRLPPGAQVLAQGQVTPAGIIPPRAPTIAEEQAAREAELTEAERAFGAAFEQTFVPEPDGPRPAPQPTQEELAALEAADRTLRTAWEARNPSIPEEAREFIFPEEAIADPSTLEDRQTVRGLFLKSNTAKGKRGQSAATIFGKYPTVVQGLEHIAELRSRDKDLSSIVNNTALNQETIIDPENVSELFGREMRPLDYGNALDFFEIGIEANTGANAAQWVKANLSPEANFYLLSRIEALKASEAAVKERTTLYDPVAIADKATDKEVKKTQQAYEDDSYLIATAAAAGISVAELENAIPKSVNIRSGAEPEVVREAIEKAALRVAEQRKQSKIPQLPTDFTATEQELADARRGIKRPLRVGGWTGLELAVASKYTRMVEQPIETKEQAKQRIRQLSPAELGALTKAAKRYAKQDILKREFAGWTALEVAAAKKHKRLVEAPIITRKQAQAKIEQLTDEEIAKLHDDLAVEREFLNLFRRFKAVRQTAILDVPLGSMARAALMNNNLQAALMYVARTSPDAEVKAVARAIAANIASTQVRLVDPADPANPLEADTYGAYDPETDTVFLPNTGDITIQTLLHETGHAVTTAFIDANPNSVEVQDLKALFSSAYTQVMPYLTSVPYREDGRTPTPDEVTATEIKEFVTELKSNMELRDTLRNLSLTDLRVPRKGTLQNALEWVKNLYRRIMNKVTRGGPQPNALARADFLIDKVMTPQRAAGDVLFSRGSRPGTGVSGVMQLIRPLRAKAMTPTQRQQLADNANEYLNTAQALGQNTLMGLLPPQAVADIAAKVGIADPYRMYELVQRRDGLFSRAAQRVDVQDARLTRYYKNNPAEKEAFDTLTTDSSVEGFDPSIDPTVPATQDRNYTKAWLAFDVLDADGNILRTQRRFFDTPVERDNAIARLNANPPATRTRARKAGDPRTPGELQTLQALKDRYNALSPEGRAMYNQLRDFYESLYDEQWSVMQGDMDTIFGADPRTAAEAKQSLYVQLFDKGQIRPYFPLVREGDYWLEFSAFNPATNSTEAVKMSFETDGARQRMAALLASEPAVQKDANGVPITVQYTAADMSGPSFRTDLLFVKNIADIFDKYNARVDDKNKISDEVMNDIAAMIVKAAPEGSMARQLHKRNNTPGYIEDAQVALHNKGYRLANSIARQVSSMAIRKQAQEYEKAAKNNPNRNQQLILQELIAFGNNALSPMDSAIDRAAQAANRFAYAYTLLGNMSSAVVNTASFGNVIWPQLGGRYGYNKAAAELMRAARLFMGSGLKRTVRQGGEDTTISALPSIDNYYIMEPNGDYIVRTDIQMDAAKRARLERIAPLIRVLSERGAMHHSLFFDSMGLQDFARARSKSDKAYAFFSAPIHVTERMTRQATAIAAYELELNRLTAENAAAGNPQTLAELQTQAANEALYRTTEMNGGASLNTAPRLTQRGLMRVAMMYKQYGITVTTLLFKTARQIVNNIYGSSPEMKAARDIAMRQMMGHLGITFLLAGVHGLPMYGLASVIYNTLKDDEELSLDEAVRLQIGELYYKGPVNALTGFEVSERVGLSELLYRANRYNNDPSAEESIVQLLGGPAWSTASGLLRGFNDMREGEYYRGFESMLPLAISNFMRAGRFYFEGGVQTRGDNFIYEDLTSSELIGRALGFNSAELVRRQDRSSEMVRIGKSVSEQRTKLIERLFLAYRAGDDDGAQQAIEDIIEFNNTVGMRFPPAAIDQSDISDSFDRRIDTIQEMVNGVSINPQVRDILAMEYNAIQDGLTRY